MTASQQRAEYLLHLRRDLVYRRGFLALFLGARRSGQLVDIDLAAGGLGKIFHDDDFRHHEAGNMLAQRLGKSGFLEVLGVLMQLNPSQKPGRVAVRAVENGHRRCDRRIGFP